MTYNLNRFLDRLNSHVDHERPPVVFIQVRDQATAEAEEIAAIRARLDEFDKQFSSSDNHLRN